MNEVTIYYTVCKKCYSVPKKVSYLVSTRKMSKQKIFENPHILKCLRVEVDGSLKNALVLE